MVEMSYNLERREYHLSIPASSDSCVTKLKKKMSEACMIVEAALASLCVVKPNKSIGQELKGMIGWLVLP